MIPFAASHNLRLVLLNLRDYPGSTRYSPEELAALGSPIREVQAAAIEARGLELAAFMRWYIETERVPAISKEPDRDVRPAGGVAILGWSSGNCQTIPLLASANKVPEDTRILLDAYFRSFFIYDVSQTAMGMSPMEDLYSPFRDPAMTNQEKMAAFPAWVSSYFTQATIDPSEDSESPGFGAMLLGRRPMHETEENIDPRFTPTTQRMGPETLKEVVDFDVMARSQILIQLLDPTIYQDNFRAALFECYLDDGSGEERIIWPDLKVHLIWCDMTTGDGVFAANTIKYIAGQYHKMQRGRLVEFHKVEQANHFHHWDEPERFIELLAQTI